MSMFQSNLPTKEDVMGVVTSFSRLQKTYNITAKEMASGNLFGLNIPQLNGKYCYIL